eukprot:9496052-Pyramimonas_sp.AAC.1
MRRRSCAPHLAGLRSHLPPRPIAAPRRPGSPSEDTRRVPSAAHTPSRQPLYALDATHVSRLTTCMKQLHS